MFHTGIIFDGVEYKDTEELRVYCFWPSAPDMGSGGGRLIGYRTRTTRKPML